MVHSNLTEYLIFFTYLRLLREPTGTLVFFSQIQIRRGVYYFQVNMNTLKFSTSSLRVYRFCRQATDDNNPANPLTKNNICSFILK